MNIQSASDGERAVFFFTVKATVRDRLWDRMRWLNSNWPGRVITELPSKKRSKRKATHVTEASVLFLLTPNPKSNDYKLFVLGTPCIQKNPVARPPLGYEEVKALARGETITKSDWIAYDIVKHGLFYSVTSGLERRLMAVVPGTSFCYWGRDSTLSLLGKPTAVLRVSTDLMLAEADVKRLKEILTGLRNARSSRAPATSVQQFAQLSWEVLPAGWWARRALRLGVRGRRRSSNHLERTERIALLDGLKPTAWYRGSLLGEHLYFVAVFNGVAIADAEEFGNALYYYKCENDSWQGVFRLSKRAALANGARRIIHSEGWERRVRNLVWAAEHIKFEGRPQRVV